MSPVAIKKTPRQEGFHMPAEWAPHSAIWLSWPHDSESFPHPKKADSVFANFIREVCESETVELRVLNGTMQKKAEEELGKRGTDMSRILFHIGDYGDIWFRDYGPSFVVNRETKTLAMTKWEFNAWGGKYEELLKDNGIPYEMNASLGLQMFNAGIVLEGGSIEVNGKGTVLTTEQCLLNKNRNPQLSRKEIEWYLAEYLGAPNVIWLGEGIEGDDTDGHVDDFARFVNETTVIAALEEDVNDANYETLKKNFEILEHSTAESGQKLTVVPFPTPGKVISDSGRRLPAGYANFYIGNTVVLVPTFGAKNDEMALDLLRPFFPERKVLGIDATYLAYGNGTFHCMSQQQPLP